MMRFLFLSVFAFLLVVSSSAQTIPTGTVYGLEFTTGQLRLASADPTTGQVQVISSAPTSGDMFGSGNSDIDPVNDLYYYVRAGQIVTVHLPSGVSIHGPAITCATHQFNAIQPISNIAYNWVDGKIYGLLHFGNALWFATVDPITGVMTVLSNGPISPDQYQSGVSDIDPLGNRYFYTRGNKLYTVNIPSGVVSNIVTMNNPNNATLAITNIAYDWLTDQIYGLNYVGAQWNNFGQITTPAELRLAAVNPNTGTLNIISPSAISSDQFQSGVSDIDPVNGVYYYIRAGFIYTVHLQTGIAMNVHALSNNYAISPLTNIAVYKDFNTFPAPIATFIDHHHNLTVQFQNTSAYAMDISWDFGDGHYSNERHPTHTYENAGIHFVTLKVESANGNIHTETKMIDVRKPDPVDPFSPTPDEQTIFANGPGNVVEDPFTSVNELEADFSVKVFPNPAADQVMINVTASNNAQVQFTDLQGRAVFSGPLQSGSNVLEISNWAPGLYFYQVQGVGQEQSTGRLMVR